MPSEDKDLSPLLVGFAGHRDARRLGDIGHISEALREAFRDVLAKTPGAVPRLIVGAATGADQLAIAAWSAIGLSDVCLFLTPGDQPPPELTPLAVRRFDDARGQADALVSASHILVVVWDGVPARAPGGTGYTVECAARMAKPIVHIRPAAPTPSP